MTTSLVLAQLTIAPLERLGQGVSLMVVGMLVVFCALSLTAGTIAVLNRFLGLKEDEPYDPRSRPAAAVGAGPTSDQHLQVVLAAAAAAALGRTVRSVRVTPKKE